MKKQNFNHLEIEAKLNYCFQNKALLEQAFIRRSYVQEHPEKTDNEVLEFIGDSVLSFIVVKHLSERYRYKTAPHTDGEQFNCELDEAELSDFKIMLVQCKSLARATTEAKLEKYLLMGKSDLANQAQNEASAQEDLFESILGAVAIDSNWNEMHLTKVLSTLLDIDERLENIALEHDYVQELANSFKEFTLTYQATPSCCQNLKFGYSVTLEGELFCQSCYGYGNTEEGARQMAAKRAVKEFKKIFSFAALVKTHVGEPSFERAINQLQELYQKKIISEPKYTFTQNDKLSSGKTKWACSCSIDNLYEPNGEYFASTKAHAKKYAAFDALCALCGQDISLLFTQHGKKVNKEETV